jgi:hypothetical protein
MNGREILYDDNEPIANDDTYLIALLREFSQYRNSEKSYCRAYKLLGTILTEISATTTICTNFLCN